METMKAILHLTSDFEPHGQCLLWQADVLWLHVISDSLIALSYYSIPIGLVYFVRKRQDLPFNWMFLMFGAFILACGTTHIMGVLTIWRPSYWLDGAIKAGTAVISVASAVLLWPLIPKALALPSPTQLEQVNRDLRREIAEHRKTEASLRESEQRYQLLVDDLKRSNAELEQFAYVSSHDLQEPLRMVTTYMQLVERRYKSLLDEKAREYIGFAVAGATRMKTLIEDLLTYSRVGSQPIGMERTDCATALAQAITNLEKVISETATVITWDPLPSVVADSRQMCQLFQNLLSNAMKYRSGTPPTIHVGVKRGTNEFIFSVRDNGLGIEPAYFDRIFLIFQRLHTNEEHPGSGIGLAICKKIVERHRGRIWVDSQPGKGSTFFFTLGSGG